MSEAPAELWLRPWAGGWYETQFRDEPAAVRYVRADLYEELRRVRVDLFEALFGSGQQEPLGTDYR